MVAVESTGHLEKRVGARALLGPEPLEILLGRLVATNNSAVGETGLKVGHESGGDLRLELVIKFYQRASGKQKQLGDVPLTDFVTARRHRNQKGRED